jgi:hypothetical protein
MKKLIKFFPYSKRFLGIEYTTHEFLDKAHPLQGFDVEGE